jgi:hypothetical protein
MYKVMPTILLVHYYGKKIQPEGSDKFLVVLDNPQDVAVEEDGKDALVGDLLTRQEQQVLHASVQGQPHDRCLVDLNVI